ncbi:MAG: hypothetical protein KAS02_02360 [Candidatus Pacebacteria bacterium]|nr:hypothetical protein [Candidatus Paceibacterota bacterium]
MELFTSNLQTTTVVPTWVLVLIMLWVLPWKGYSMWLAAKNNQKKWFIALLVLNTLAILDIIYIFFINKKK